MDSRQCSTAEPNAKPIGHYKTKPIAVCKTKPPAVYKTKPPAKLAEVVAGYAEIKTNPPAKLAVRPAQSSKKRS